MATKKETKAKKELLTTIRERYRAMTEFDERNRQEAMVDMKFTNVPGSQWDENMKIERGERPCYEFNKIRVTCKRVINEMRANRPSGKVRGVEDADKKTAEVYEGLIRNIWNTSDGDTVIDTAAEYQVSAGMGAWRINTKYSSDTAFNQDIVLEPIQNPFCLFADNAAKDQLKRDAMDWILTEKISIDAFEKKWPKAEVVDWESTQFDDEEEWQTDEEVRIAEYWWKEPVEKEIWLLEDGKVVDSESDEAKGISKESIKSTRTVQTHQVKMCIASGEAILEGPTDWAGKELPFVMIYGEYMLIDGIVQWFGLPRFAKDAQRSYNISRTAIAETIAQAPLAKFWTTPKQAEGNTTKWAEAHQKNYPFQIYNPDPAAPGAPQRMGGADVPVALMQESQMASDEIKSVTGIFSADLGAGNQASSGRQEIARQQQGQIATFNYQDNLAKGVRRTWEILVDLIPQIYDTERTLRILGQDGSEDYVKINTFVPGETGEMVKVHDMSEGQYDVTITVGPGFATKRQEAVEAYQAIIQGNPEVMGFAGDLIFKSMDLPYAEEIGERFKAMLPPEVQQTLNQDKEVPPEVQQMMQQADQAMQEVQAMAQEVQQAAMEADKEKSVNDKDKAEIRTLIANLKTEEAQFEAKIAKALAGLAEKQSSVTIAETQLESGVELSEMNQAHEQLMVDAAQTVESVNQITQQFMDYAVGILGEISEKSEDLDPRPKVIRIDSYRENGKLVAVPVYEEPDQEAPGRT